MADRLESSLVDIAALISLPRNAKRHDLDTINRSYQRWGFVDRILANRVTGHLVSGHGRIEALLRLKAEGGPLPGGIVVRDGAWLVPVDYVSVPEGEEMALAVALNRTVELGGWDDAALAEVLRDLAAMPAGLDGVGFGEADLDALLASLKAAEPDTREDHPEVVSRADELQEKWQIQRGQIWLCGKHRVMCGDSTDAGDVGRLMAGEKAVLSVTSPPYGVGKEYEAGGLEGWQTLIRATLPLVARYAPMLAINLGDVKVGPNQREIHTYGHLVRACEDAGLPLVGTRIWSKGAAWAGQGPYWLSGYRAVDEYEYIGLFGSAEYKDRIDADWKYRGVWDIPSVSANKLHSAAYPLELPSRLMQLLCDAGSLVLDPFLGSGTTLIAAEKLGRICVGMEIHPPYVSVVLERYLAFTGDMPRLADAG